MDNNDLDYMLIGNKCESGRVIPIAVQALINKKHSFVEFEVGDFVWAVLTKDRCPVGEFKNLTLVQNNSYARRQGQRATIKHILDLVAPYFRGSGFPMVFMSIQHRPMLSWGVQLYISPSGAVRFKEGCDRFIEDNNVTAFKFLLFDYSSLPNMRVLINDGNEGTLCISIPCGVDIGGCSTYNRLDDQMYLHTSFVRTNFPDVGRSNMILTNGDGTVTVVTTISCKGTLLLSIGFSEFRSHNNFSASDKCKFVLVGYKTLFVTKATDAY
ncbi:hypothetical protein M0R45_026531 [Rubus argutus]|uniref:Uncharacterized protein n=1 Tax=Rubus argutus TaxID=59490 RepID=A0AAW1WXV9_RUBAR